MDEGYILSYKIYAQKGKVPEQDVAAKVVMEPISTLVGNCILTIDIQV